MLKKKKNRYKYLIDNKMRYDGYCDFEKREIKINQNRVGLVNTVLHENLHREHPLWGERRVIRESKEIEARLTIIQTRNLLNNLINKISKSKKYGKQ